MVWPLVIVLVKVVRIVLLTMLACRMTVTVVGPAWPADVVAAPPEPPELAVVLPKPEMACRNVVSQILACANVPGLLMQDYLARLTMHWLRLRSS